MLCLALYFFQPAVASAANKPPTISGSPATTVSVGKVYWFRPTASDPDGNTLKFKISKKPVWASFSSTSGRLTGTPTASQTGTFSNIVISVSDGIATRALPAFSIKVLPATPPVPPVHQSSVTLRWVPPTQNVDGTQLTNLAGYQIHYGNVPGQYTNSVSVGSPSITSAVIENLEPATWYFAVKSVSSSGTQSAFSTQVSKTL